MEPAINTSNLAVGYGTTPLLHKLNLTLRAGEMTALIGPNGAGKSTLLRTLAAQLRPIEGSITFRGVPLDTLSLRERARLMSLVYTDPTLAGALLVREMVSLGRQPHTGVLGRLDAHDRQRVDEAMQLASISHKAEAYIAQLSDGERQKAMIARALAQDTPCILLDEPTTYLDVASRLEIMALLRNLAHRQGRAILLSTHEIAPALQMADNIWAIDAAKKQVITGTPQAISAPGGVLEGMFEGRDIYFSHTAGDYRLRQH